MGPEGDPPRVGRLHLHRNVGEKFVINPGAPGQVVVEVLGVYGYGPNRAVRLGVTAARHVNIRRAEAGPVARPEGKS